jgi:hypothetical protein
MVRVIYRNQWISMFVRNEHMHRLSKFSQVARTLRSSRNADSTSRSRQQKRYQNRDDGHDDQEFSQREAGPQSLS